MQAPLWQAMLDALPPDGDVHPVDGAVLGQYAEHVSEDLLEFWRRVGWGSFGEGLLRFVDPERLADTLALWLRSKSLRRVPFAISAFGEIFYWRDLRAEAAQKGMTGANPGELGDVSAVDVHYSSISVFALDMAEFFAAMGEEETLDTLFRRKLARAATAIYGPLAPDEQWAFVPSLAWGGRESIECVRKVALAVHQDILRQ